MTRIQKAKKTVRAFMQAHYTDKRLAQLLCHARDGKLAYYSCCCFIGIPTANHALKQKTTHVGVPHYEEAKRLNGAGAAEVAFCELMLAGNSDFKKPEDEVRRRVLIPMIRAEMKRREKAQAEKQFEQQLQADAERVYAEQAGAMDEAEWDARADTRR